MARYPTTACLPCLACLVMALPVPILAQDPAPTDAANADAPVCLARSYPDTEQVPAGQRGKSHFVPATARTAPSLEKKGFSRVECSTARMSDKAAIAAWRDEVCELASLGNAAVQNQLERALGERPAVLCALAEQLSGPWDRRQAGKIRATR